MVEVPCPQCGTRLRVPRAHLGTDDQCPVCGLTFPLIPDAIPVAADDVDPTAATAMATPATPRPALRSEPTRKEPKGFSFDDIPSPNVERQLKHADPSKRLEPIDIADDEDMSDDERRRWGTVRTGLGVLYVAWGSLCVLAAGSLAFLVGSGVTAWMAPRLLTRSGFEFVCQCLSIGAALVVLTAAGSYFHGTAFCSAAPLRSARLLASCTMLVLVGLVFGSILAVALVASTRGIRNNELFPVLDFNPIFLLSILACFAFFLLQLSLGARFHVAVARRFRDLRLIGSFGFFSWLMPVIVTVTTWGSLAIALTLETMRISEAFVLLFVVDCLIVVSLGVWYILLNRRLRRLLPTSRSGTSSRR